jgi:hypothetical protein
VVVGIVAPKASQKTVTYFTTRRCFIGAGASYLSRGVPETGDSAKKEGRNGHLAVRSEQLSWLSNLWQIIDRVYCLTIFEKFKVEMIFGGQSGVTNKSNHVSLLYLVTFFHIDRLQV